MLTAVSPLLDPFSTKLVMNTPAVWPPLNTVTPGVGTVQNARSLPVYTDYRLLLDAIEKWVTCQNHLASEMTSDRRNLRWMPNDACEEFASVMISMTPCLPK